MKEQTTSEYVRDHLPLRPADSHKDTFGRLLLYCGSEEYPGAALLAAEGALRCGVGRAELVAAERVCDLCLFRLPEVVCHPWPADPAGLPAADAVVYGCGRGDSERTSQELTDLLVRLTGPAVLDADGLNALSHAGKYINKTLQNAAKPLVLTPHPREFVRLFGGEIPRTPTERCDAALRAARACGQIVLLKGHRTVIATPDGRLAENVTRTSALAKAGAGDVLAGMIGAFLAQGVEPFVAARMAAYLHGCAADVLAGCCSEYGVLISQLPQAVAALLMSLTRD